MQHQETYRIMGIDPGTNYMGYGVLEIRGATSVPSYWETSTCTN